MSKKYKYVALSDGTLSNPYQFVAKDKVVEFDEPYIAKWLMPYEEARKRKEEQVMPHMNVVNAQGSRNLNGVEALRNDAATGAPRIQASTTQFSQQLDAIIKRERNEDAANKIPPSTSSENSAGAASAASATQQQADGATQQSGGETAPQGTGNQNVI